MSVPALTDALVMQIVSQCKYKPGWEIVSGGSLRDGTMYLQVSVDASVGRCSMTGLPAAWKSGKRYLSRWMCSQEIVGVVFSLIKAAEEHEMLEWFRYKGSSIFNPHLDPDVLADVAKYRKNFVTRPDNMSMTQEEPDA
ncbi:ribosome modulation factor-like domain-containing protein [Vibrio phage vB_VpaP_G1]|uniref:Ribosome modulation factor-like domain-containing protein n=1 Tax=Vibrio phage vB_VpaP_G1 TaxID=2862773 RepID=A0AAE7WU54_9CAUD|nr:ribosome modulation factor-like domain-containing protein [Vibrio phage vB_VpaP_G1]QYW05810.1 ribosome modulation factor-like domain-containing protein [Vibrio phage vB_VpaP_G1]